MRVRPISFRDACTFVRRHHRHHGPPQGCKFCLAVVAAGNVVGVVIVGRPVARRLDDGLTAEVTRCCTDGTKNAASKLYAAARRVAMAMGYARILTYTLQDEQGTSLKAAGWRCTGTSPGSSWSVPSRIRQDKHPLGRKARWETGV